MRSLLVDIATLLLLATVMVAVMAAAFVCVLLLPLALIAMNACQTIMDQPVWHVLAVLQILAMVLVPAIGEQSRTVNVIVLLRTVVSTV